MKLEVGQYYETKDGVRYYCLAKNQFAKNYPMVVTKNESSVSTRSEDGTAYMGTSCSDDLVRHLPGCTGFDWVENKVPEGWEKISDNEKMKSGDRYLYKDGADNQPVYSYVGKTFAELKEKGIVLKDWECIIRKKKPVYTYRPFANETEFAPNFDRHILRSCNQGQEEKGAYRMFGYDEIGVWVYSDEKYTYKQMFQMGRKFADTGEPFGVKVEQNAS